MRDVICNILCLLWCYSLLNDKIATGLILRTFISGFFELTNVSVVLLLLMQTCNLQYRERGKAKNNDLKNCSKFILIYDLIVQRIIVIYKSM